MKRGASPLLIALLLLATAPAFDCRRPNEIDPLYFILFPILRGNFERPTTPTDLQVHFEPIPGALVLNWNPSRDPDLNSTFILYRIYLYLDRPPTEYYQQRHLFDETITNSYSLLTDPFTGTLYFVVTAFDGSAESLPSNVASVNLLTP